MSILSLINKSKNWWKLVLVILLLSLVLIGAESKGCLGWHAPYETYEETISGSSGIPKGPSDLMAIAVSYDQINLGWINNATTADGFKIECKTEVAGDYSLVATVGPDVTYYAHKDLTQLTTYFHRVCAYNAAGNSAYSNRTCTTTPAVPPPPSLPSPPSNLMAEVISSSEIKLTWNDNSDNEDIFKIERKIGAAVTYTQIATVGTDITIYNDTELTPTTTYFYRVRAYNEVGDSISYTNVVEASTPMGDYWTSISTIVTNAPPKRETHTAVWTGSEMIVWGGYSGGNLKSGGKYEPISGTWTAVSTDSAPTARRYHTAVWTGSQTVIWGGQDPDPTATGGVYYPVTDTWTATKTLGAPTARWNHTAVWADSINRMIVWGGRDAGMRMDTGGIYDPELDTWFIITSTLVNTPAARERHTAVWTGSEMIVWGGYDGTYLLNTGGVYDPASNTWETISTDGAPSKRRNHTAVWTGTRMIVWGGYDGKNTNTGGIYDPVTNSWDTTKTFLINGTSAPSGRQYHATVWADSVKRMIVWGGFDGTYSNTGGRYDPGIDIWEAITTTNVPSGRSKHTIIWNEAASQMIVWGGKDADNFLNNGGVCTCTVTANDWTLIPGSTAPSARSGHTAVWNDLTSQMIVWGGKDGTDYFNTGGVYDPATDYWEPLPTTGAPTEGRTNHSVVWASHKMIVWGGYDGSIWLNKGGVYNPSKNTWSAPTTFEAPSGREAHTAVWTGTEMIVWGGKDGSSYFNDGKIYHPGVSDFWTDITADNAPPIRANHTAVWTGSRMIVWGGYNGSSYLDTGGVYDPVSDTWTAVSTVYAPDPRANHTALWTGSRMLIWGGNDGSDWFNTGALYDPETDLWTDNITILDAPPGRAHHTALWTDFKMIIWGGYNGSSSLNTGGIYDPTSNSWLATTTTEAPSERRFHSAVWTGMKMIIWGGENGAYLNTGGKYQQ